MLSLRSDQGPEWTTLLVEVVLIVLGVLLGLFANEWRIGRAEQARAETALEQIRLEVAYNQSEVDSALVAYHRQIRDSLRRLRQRLQAGERVTEAGIRRALPNGFTVPLLQTTAWDLSVRTGLVNQFDLEQVAPVARLYTQQDFLQRKINQISENFYIAGNADPALQAGQIRALGALAGDIVIQEERLMRRYENVLNQLGAAQP